MLFRVLHHDGLRVLDRDVRVLQDHDDLMRDVQDDHAILEEAIII